MPRIYFTAAQVSYLRAHYADLPPTHFARRWGMAVACIYTLARRHGIKRRAPNGETVWRGGALAWAWRSRWASCLGKQEHAFCYTGFNAWAL